MGYSQAFEMSEHEFKMRGTCLSFSGDPGHKLNHHRPKILTENQEASKGFL